ncbi:hypothetical protein CPB84DRAFT_1768658 [Gymnopilus junonius]|uniref:Uncharacterized protein n=1 Tax=Gymnopilus junonius TaxID=109634 RepID=A0A9P5NY12_GYMJU|nr:hypothetical protein CPB84DRAFT_1768658 [Gymnopilus junonius]
MNAEIDILEMLSKKPHPNIVEYPGCFRDGDCILIKGGVPANQRPPFDADEVIS